MFIGFLDSLRSPDCVVRILLENEWKSARLTQATSKSQLVRYPLTKLHDLTGQTRRRSSLKSWLTPNRTSQNGAKNHFSGNPTRQ